MNVVGTTPISSESSADTQATPPEFQSPMMDAGGNKDEMMWATLAHAGTFAGLIVPFGNIIAPLAIYLIKREESAYIAEHAKESLNFQISLMIYMIISAILILVFIGIIALAVLSILWIIFAIQASIAAHKGESYRYPMTIRFIK